MNANIIQAMLAVNAARITEIHDDIEWCLAEAQENTANGDKSLAIHAHSQANHARKRLNKAVALQRTMKTELMALHRAARIVRKATLLETKVGFKFVPNVGLTSIEIENDLDDLIDLLVQKKADSRIAA